MPLPPRSNTTTRSSTQPPESEQGLMPVLAYRVLQLERRAEEDRLNAATAREDVETDFKEMEKTAATEKQAIADAFKGLDSIYVKKESVKPAWTLFWAALMAIATGVGAAAWSWITHSGK